MNQLPVNTQRSCLSLLLFSDHAQRVRSIIPLKSWLGDQALMALIGKVYEFIDNYNTAPFAHSYDLLEEIAVNKDQKENLARLISGCEMRQESLINPEYILNSAQTFCQLGKIRELLQNASQLVEQGRLEEVEDLLRKVTKSKKDIFEPGGKLLARVDELIGQSMENNSTRHDQIHLNIQPFDDYGVIPRRKEMFLIMGPHKKGKTWGLIHIGKQALKEYKKVLHLTLEVDDKIVRDRYLQGIYGLSKRPLDGRNRTAFRDNEFAYDFDSGVSCLQDENALIDVAARLKQESHIDENLYVKQFPMRWLTMKRLETFLEELEMFQNFIPDVLILDYADLMNPGGDARTLRTSLGLLYQELRGLAVERNLILVTATQVNREGISAEGLIETTHVAEDISKINTADTVISYNQTDEEREYGLARLYVAAARNEMDKFCALVTQDYATGQFVIQSRYLTTQWKDRLKGLLDKTG